jgi:hypothetical protein
MKGKLSPLHQLVFSISERRDVSIEGAVRIDAPWSHIILEKVTDSISVLRVRECGRDCAEL